VEGLAPVEDVFLMLDTVIIEEEGLLLDVLRRKVELFVADQLTNVVSVMDAVTVIVVVTSVGHADSLSV